MLAICLSRYCYDSAATLEEFKAIEARNTEKAKTEKAGDRSTEYSFTPYYSLFSCNFPVKSFSLHCLKS